ncbi:MAG TPA: TonB-dependent receptor [Candidatus Sulfopaludibacter sp.]|jgi:outer membrane receptor protein involved in Fe transport|nr:TonB-dependent receptor [Candidatus Sulfopaludibacter sp.]
MHRWVILIAAVSILWAQIPVGEIRLEVKDPSGAPMKVAGRLQNPAASIDRTFQTDSHGAASLSNLPFGRYQLKVSRTGFAAQSLTVDVQSTAPVARSLTLSLSAQASAIEVVAATPLAGTDMAIDQIPAPVQTASAHDIEQSGSLDLSDLLNRRLDGVHINENQENPFQPDVNYRGYTASPLLGTPEGISVYMDGVRQNRPFGDIVAWDLIPKIAIAEVALMPGSNPLFGLNTLGGAVSIQTKDGNSQPGLSLQVSGGSFGRRAGELEYGGSNPHGLNWYVAANLFREDGWRQASPSEVRQTFGKLGWQRGTTAVSASFSYADNWLTGNGLQDTRFLATHYSSVYTIPDITWNRSPSVSLRAQHTAAAITFSGNAYFRFIRGDTVNGDINSNSFDESLYNLSPADAQALTAAGYSGFPLTGNATTEPFPSWRCIAQGLEHAQPVEKCTGLITRTSTKENNYGLSGQAAWQSAHHRLIVGAAWDHSSMLFGQASQFGYLNPDRLTITPIDAFADGTTTSNGDPVDTRADLRGVIHTYSLFATDTVTPAKGLAFTFSGRYNRTAIDNADRLPFDPSGARGSLNGRYEFPRFNPSAGVTYAPWRTASVYFSYSEASRAPTSIELGCADPAKPCNFPNALVSDPPLKQVVTRTLEAGIRGSLETLRWSAGWFRAVNDNDLLFVASPQTGFGYFTNFGQTRRQGVETSVSRRFGAVTLGGNYTFLNATYQSTQTLDGHANSANDGGAGLDGDITVQPGDRIPQTPQNILKAYAEWQATSKFSVDVDFSAVGRSYARGNENNLYRPDGVYYLGQGFSPGYGVVNLAARFQLTKRVQVFVQVNNLLDHHYYTAAQLNTTPYNNAGNFVPRPFAAVDGNFPLLTTTFFAPGAPLGAWGGMRYRF